MRAMRANVFTAVVLGGALLVAGNQHSVADEACAGFKWPLDTELSWMGAPDSDTVQSGGKIAAVPAKALTLNLQPSKSLTLPIESGVKKQAVGNDSYSGWLTIENVATAGLYQVSLSREGWIDVAQDGKLVESNGFTGRRECATLRKSVRYQLAAGSTLIQIVGVPAESVKVTIKPAN